MPEQRSTLELIRPSTSVAPSWHGIHRIRPVVVDTSFLVADLLCAARRGQETEFLQALNMGRFEHSLRTTFGRRWAASV